MRLLRVIATVAGGLSLAACSTSIIPSTDILPSFNAAPAPATATARFESEPPGAEAKTSTGQACRTPCALPLPAQPFTVTFELQGYIPQQIDVQASQPEGRPDAGFREPAHFSPNPIVAALEPAPPPPVKKRRRVRKPVARKPAPRPRRPAAAAPPPAPAATMSPASPPPGQLSPWPAAPPPQPQ